MIDFMTDIDLFKRWEVVFFQKIRYTVEKINSTLEREERAGNSIWNINLCR